MPDDGSREHPVRAYLSSLEHIGIKLGLEQIRGLLDALDRPHAAYRSIIIAGTNGKGSTAAMTERALRAAGYRTGRYTSPHLVAIEERVAVDGLAVNAGAFDSAAERVQRAADRLPAPPSFFEATTAVALEAFREAAIDIAVLEVGLGGRLDATNAVDASAAVVTAIDFDHEQYLGYTIEAIAGEKAAVIKPGATVVLAHNPPGVEAVVAARCAAVGADLVRAWTDLTLDVQMVEGRAHLSLGTPTRQYADVTLGLRGRHQVDNAIAAVRLLEAITSRGLCTISAHDIRTGLEQVEWPGRLETGSIDGHDVLIDGAHNAAGARALASYLDATYGRRVPLVLGAMADKDITSIARALAPRASVVVCTRASSSRAAAPQALAASVALAAPDVAVVATDNVRGAVAMAASYGSPVVIAGSLYLAGEVRRFLS